MICKHCGYDVPSGIEFCTNCGEPMPRPKQEETPVEDNKQPEKITDKKYFIKNYVPHSYRLCIIAAALISYIYSALFLLLAVAGFLTDGLTTGNILTLCAVIIFVGLSIAFHIKKNTFCAILVTIISIAYSVYCYMTLGEVTFIWICAGILGAYGCAKLNGIWNQYRRTGKLPKQVE